MNDPPNGDLLGPDLWEPALEKYAAATHTTVELFNAESRVVVGPIHRTPVFQLFHQKGYDPGLFAECAQRCLENPENHSSVITVETHGLGVIGTPLMLDGRIVAAAVAGYAFADFAQVSDIEKMARRAGIRFEELWRIAREQKPLPQRRLILNAELLRVLGEAVLQKDARTRQYEKIATHLESIVEERTTALRQLTADLLRVQDEERQKIARELHDSLGQSLAGVKMSVDALARKPAKTWKEGSQTLSRIATELARCLTETRCLSYLLHPPGLDELGFASAAQLYVEGFSQRSGIPVRLTIPSELNRLPPVVELVLFRILQESLTNVFRHAHSPSADVQLRVNQEQIELAVRDHGKGMPPELLRRLTTSGEGAGIGLRSMRERLRELDGQFKIESDESGTRVRAILPLSACGG